MLQLSCNSALILKQRPWQLSNHPEQVKLFFFLLLFLFLRTGKTDCCSIDHDDTMTLIYDVHITVSLWVESTTTGGFPTTKGQLCGALIFSLLLVSPSCSTNGWVDSDFRCYNTHVTPLLWTHVPKASQNVHIHMVTWKFNMKLS